MPALIPPFLRGWRYEYQYLLNGMLSWYEKAQFWYAFAAHNPDLVPELDNALKTMKDMTFEEKLYARTKLLELETAIFEYYTPAPYEEVSNQDI